MTNRLLQFFILLLFSIFISCKTRTEYHSDISKPVLIVTTDIGGDPDDQQSLVRLLLYANDFDIRGIIASASGTMGELGVDTVKDQLVMEYIEAYRQVYPSLIKHSDYPDPVKLAKVVKKGNPHRGLENIGQGMDTEGSEHIISVIDAEKDRKVNICIWGGQTDFAQALWKVKNTRNSEEYENFISRIRVYDINDQDNIYSWIRQENPSLFYVLAKAPDGADKREGAYRGMYLGGDEYSTSHEWIDTNIRLDHGALGALYPEKAWTAPNPHGAMKEGDTPSWFFFLENNLQDADHPEWGGWGGRFRVDSAQFYCDAEDFGIDGIHARATVYRWRNYFQNDFAARMKWCTATYEEANHSPVAVISKLGSKGPVFADMKAGEKVSFDASGSFDPDDDELNYFWWTYPEPGSNEVCPELENNLEPVVSFLVPDEKGRDIHLVCEVSDNGKPAMTSFIRIICRIN